MEKPKKARSFQPPVRTTTPDETLRRYHVDLFNPATGKAKDALFEDIDFNLYKPGAKSIAFTTTEARMSSWIRCFIERYYKQLNDSCDGFRATWEEQDSVSNPDSCDRIIIHLYVKDGEKEHHLVAITIYISTGTLFVQGRLYRNYGMIEFPLLLDIVNKLQEHTSSDDYNTTLYTSTLPDFLKQSSSPDTGDIAVERKEEKDATREDDIAEKDDDSDHAVDTSLTEDATGFRKPMEPTPSKYTPRLHTLTTLRNSVATMECEFATFQIDMKQSLQRIQESAANNENLMKDRLCQFDNVMKLKVKNLEDENRELKISNETMQEEISKLSSTVKKLQDQISSIKKKNNNLEEKQETTTTQLKALWQNQSKECQETNNADTSEHCVFVETPEEQETNTDQTNRIVSAIPLRNAFEALQDEPDERNRVTDEEANQESLPKNKPAPQQQQRRKPETVPSGQSRLSSNETGDTIILCDSNGKYLKLKRLCPDRKVTYFRCPTAKQGIDIIESSDFGRPQTILIHTGTNDLDREHSRSQSTSDLTHLITTAADKYPTSRVLYSTLLPRQDIHNEEISKINTLLEKQCSRLANVHLIDHSNLFHHDVLHDSKHLNQYGVRLFAKNLKDMIYGRTRMQPQPNSRLRHSSPRVNNRDENYMVTGQEQDRSRPTYAAALQRSPPRILHPAEAHPTSTSPPPMTTTTSAFQQRVEQQGHMNISIPNKIFPLIQILNNLIQN